MKIDADLISIRKDYDAQSIDADTFRDRVNAALATVISTVTAAEKIAAFDKIAKSIATNYAIDHLEDNVQYINSDLDHYVWEEAMQSVLGQRIFDFYNATYEGT